MRGFARRTSGAVCIVDLTDGFGVDVALFTPVLQFFGHRHGVPKSRFLHGSPNLVMLPWHTRVVWSNYAEGRCDHRDRGRHSRRRCFSSSLCRVWGRDGDEGGYCN